MIYYNRLLIEGVSAMEDIRDIEYASLLYDFYGDLLNDSKLEVMKAYHEDNLSLAEIAENLEMSRQGVHYTLKKAESKLHYYEKQLGLVDRYLLNLKKLSRAEQIIDDLMSNINISDIDKEKIIKLKTALEDFAE